MLSLTLDFTRVLALPAVHLYEGVRIGRVLRVAALPDLLRDDLVQRFSAFTSQVSVLEQGDETLPVYMGKE